MLRRRRRTAKVRRSRWTLCWHNFPPMRQTFLAVMRISYLLGLFGPDKPTAIPSSDKRKWSHHHLHHQHPQRLCLVLAQVVPNGTQGHRLGEQSWDKVSPCSLSFRSLSLLTFFCPFFSFPCCFKHRFLITSRCWSTWLVTNLHN